MAVRMLVVLFAAYSVHAAHIQVEGNNLRHVAHTVKLAANMSINNDIECGVTMPVSAESDMNKRCPESCPLYVEDKRNTLTCDFACVANSVASCKEMNPRTPVPDMELGECRHCRVPGCDKCLNDGTDTCAKCLIGYSVTSWGSCWFSGPWLVAHTLLYIVMIAVLVGVGFVVWWVVDLSMREEVNAEALNHALASRSRAKIHMPKIQGEERSLWPLLDTNMCNEDVAGPAVQLLFNFQAAIIVWAAVLAVVWWCLGNFVDSDMMILGTRGAETTRQDCINVKWGYHTMHRTMWLKVGYLEFAYIFSFVGAILFSMRQRYIFDAHGTSILSHQDYAIVLRGLPEIPGEENVERDLKAAVQYATKEDVVGVSVGWQVGEDSKDTLQVAIDSRLREIISARASTMNFYDQNKDTEDDEIQPMDFSAMTTLVRIRDDFQDRLHKVFKHIEKMFVSPATQRILSRGRKKSGVRQKPKITKSNQDLPGISEEGEAEEEIGEAEVTQTLKDLKTSSTAVVVFETQDIRDKVAEQWKVEPLEFPKGNPLQGEIPEFEPSAVIWLNLKSEHTMQEQCIRVAGILIFVAMMIALLFLFEYGYYHVQLNQVFATGEETISLSFILTTIGVAAMMSVMCICSAEVADRCKFERVGSRETCFVVLYTFSVMLQVSLDLVIAYLIGKHLMDVNDIYTYDGKKIEDMNIWEVKHFVDVFEAYAMQKQLGVTVVSFGFPCAFLLPFLAEPIVSIFVPYKLMALIVGSHPEIDAHSAESYLEAIPMDLGRYGDIMINVIVGSLILWFPGGFTFTIFMFLALSHLYIYWLDHYRVLRSVQNVYISTYNSDFVAQMLFSIPCALIAGALVFKSNCADSTIAPYVYPTTQLYRLGLPGSPCDEGHHLIFKVALTCIIHLVLHYICLATLVPLFHRRFMPSQSKELGQIKYHETAQKYACSWFSANLVHCLRSEYIYKDDPPSDYCVSGKEHLMRANPSIGSFFKDSKAPAEDYRAPLTPSSTDVLRAISKRLDSQLAEK